MDPSRCREQLGRLMAEETAALRELADMLEREHGFLEANDVISLEGATRERQRCVARIYRIDEQRRALCQERGVSLDHLGLEQLLLWCDPERTLAAGWADCAAAAAACRRLNDRNGALVAARLQHVQARLGALISTRREPATYGPRGAYAQASSGRVLTTEA
ncbi:MAG TPA: flagellar protein FlgN [Steroidobacteraceae bacterium]|nr:flagellar protein FlgN [Steroidobacteraceae bacterium]